MLISESGSSRQLELTPFRIRVAVAGCAMAVVLAFVWILGAGTVGMRSGGATRETALLEQVRQLQEDLKQKEIALSASEQRVKELQEGATLAAVAKRTVPESGPAKAVPADNDADDGPLTTVPDAAKTTKPVTSSKPSPGEDDQETGQRPVVADAGPRKPSGFGSSAPAAAGTAKTGPGQVAINFNAEDVTATAETSSNGAITFKLVKDQPELRFSGYLFVFVEIMDQRGETKIYAYPDTARLGDEDLPSDFKEGESISFKYNTRVELPFGDIRAKAELSRVSILLYNESGKIVFQRGFERKELRMVTAKGHSDGAKPKPSERRRAL